MRSHILPFGLLGAAGVAFAAGSWSGLRPAFPGLPCQDGWAACMVDGAYVSPGMVLDGAQRPHPADMRVGFFDFAPLPSLSPFAGLTAYSGAPVAELAAAEPPPAERAPREVADAPPEVEQRPARPAREEREDDAPVAVAAAPRTPPPAPAPAAAPASAPSTRPASAPATPAPVPAPPPPVAAPSKAPPPAPAAPPPAPVAVAAAPPPPPPAAPARPPAPADNSCDDLVNLEAPAMMGQLGAERRKCLEGRLASASSQTEKKKISVVLIFDAEGRGDKGDWERLMERHLEQIDRSDPNMCLKYAIHLSRGGAGRARQVIRWADYALENKQAWTGATYKKNVFGLYKLRAQGANKIWQAAEAKFVEERNDENEQAAARARGVAKDYSREWLDYARASQQETKEPLALCVSAAGNKEFCEG